MLQICWSLDDKETKNKEMRALIEAMDEQRLNEGLIITWLDEDSSDKKIRIIPLWKWFIRS